MRSVPLPCREGTKGTSGMPAGIGASVGDEQVPLTDIMLMLWAFYGVDQYCVGEPIVPGKCMYYKST